MSFPDDNLSIPCPINRKLIQMEGIGIGKITTDFGVSRSKVKVTIYKNRIYCPKIWSVWEIFIFYPISMGKNWIPLNEYFHTYANGFLVSLTVFKIIGVKGVWGGGKKNFFSSDFDGVFCKCFIVKNAIKLFPNIFSPSCTVFQVKGVERGQKMPSFCMSFPDDNLSIPCLIETKKATPKILKLFQFSSDFDGVFSNGFLM